MPEELNVDTLNKIGFGSSPVEKPEISLIKKFEELHNEIKAVFLPGGLIEQNRDKYEYRHQQMQMALGINDSFKNSKHFACEAGTGSGKSYAYLIPAMMMVKKMPNKGPVLITTGTITLQEQITKKDVPFLKDIVPGVEVVLAKGRSNYLCPYRFSKNVLPYINDVRKLGTLAKDDEQFINFGDWVKSTKTGDKTEIEFQLDKKVWFKACSKLDDCDASDCKEQCFLREAKAKLKNADAIIANHHLLFADLEVRRKSYATVLPDYNYLIIDEAHKMEDIATDYLSYELSNGMIKELLNDSYNYNNDKVPGVIYSIFMNVNVLEKDKFDLEFIPVHDDLRISADEFFKCMETFPEKEKMKRINIFDEFEKRVNYHRFQDNLRKFDQMLKVVDRFAVEHKDSYSKDTLKELASVITRTLKFIDFLKMVEEFDQEYVYYVENSGSERRKRTSLKMQPINVAGIIKEEIFDRVSSVIMTSATLSTNGDFVYFKGRVGLEENFYQAILPPVFDYLNQVNLYVAMDLPNPKKSYEDFNREVVTRIGELLLGLNGKAFVLFTSYALLNSAYDKLNDMLEEKGIKVLVQGNGVPTAQLLKEFKNDVDSVLFGTDTFWEGVDVPGEALSNIIITKLPFSVPNHPVIQARMEYIDKNGGNSFFEYTIPKAIIKLKQGFGRLIRSKTDVGTCSILDPRVMKMGYGRIFMNSLPACRNVLKLF